MGSFFRLRPFSSVVGSGAEPYPAASTTGTPTEAVFLAAAFLTGALFFAVFVGAFAAAFFAAKRFFSAATMFAMPALLSFRFGFETSGSAGAAVSDLPRLAHLAICAKAIFRRVTAENVLRFLVERTGVAAGSAGVTNNLARSSAILVSIRDFWAVKPSMAVSGAKGAKMAPFFTATDIRWRR